MAHSTHFMPGAELSGMAEPRELEDEEATMLVDLAYRAAGAAPRAVNHPI